MNQPKLVGIHGPLNGGKDTTANYLQAKYPDKFGRYAFAQPIKHASQVMFGFTKEQLEDRILKETVDPFWEFTPRKAMQLLGTEYGRDMLRKDLWIKRAELEHRKNIAINRGTLITDVRFENEAEWIRSHPNSMLIYIQVPNLDRDEKYNHESENGIELDVEFDHVIVNQKELGLEQLFTQLDEIVFG